jgi:hypothetical protein
MPTVDADEPTDAPPPDEWVNPEFPEDDSDIPEESAVESIYVDPAS